MRKLRGLIWVAVLWAASCSAIPQTQDAPPVYPHVLICTGDMAMDVYLPDPVHGYYRGPRFDWSGMVRQLTWRGHTFFTPLIGEEHDPTNPEDAVGPAEEFGFDSPLGYAETPVGQTFIKIGVGELRKCLDQPYDYASRYPIVRPAAWTVTHDDHSITFHQHLHAPSGWGYDYTKTLTLNPRGPSLTIIHTLRNTGVHSIHTSHYSHNFVAMDQRRAVSPGECIEFLFEPRVVQKHDPGIVTITGRQVRFTGPLGPGQYFWMQLAGFDGAADAQVRIVDPNQGLALTIQQDQPPEKMVIFAKNACLCGEIFTPVNLEPGQAMTWQTVYLPAYAESATGR